jgi:hypothetical protein
MRAYCAQGLMLLVQRAMHKIEIDLGDRKQTSVCLMLTSNAPAAK